MYISSNLSTSPSQFLQKFQDFRFSPLKPQIRDKFHPKCSKNAPNRPISPNPKQNTNSVTEFVSISSDNADSVNSGSGDRRNSVSGPSSFDFLELKRELDKEENESGGGVEEEEEVDEIIERKEITRSVGERGFRQVMRRSSLLAKQVISVESARSLGFVSQLWVDTRSWMVVLVEVRPNLLSGEMEKFLLDDITRVGDVVLVEEDDVFQNDLKMIGLDTLVGYNVVTSGRRKFGKVRGYTFNINSGAVESLELDSFGFSIIPSSLVSTYCLFVEDVVEVASDTIVVDEYAASRVQRLTKGILDAPSVEQPSDAEYFEYGRRPTPVGHRKSSKRRPRRRRETEEDWEHPMDYY